MANSQIRCGASPDREANDRPSAGSRAPRDRRDQFALSSGSKGFGHVTPTMIRSASSSCLPTKSQGFASGEQKWQRQSKAAMTKLLSTKNAKPSSNP
jgi:hypothetical protein